MSSTRLGLTRDASLGGYGVDQIWSGHHLPAAVLVELLHHFVHVSINRQAQIVGKAGQLMHVNRATVILILTYTCMHTRDVVLRYQ